MIFLSPLIAGHKTVSNGTVVHLSFFLCRIGDGESSPGGRGEGWGRSARLAVEAITHTSHPVHLRGSLHGFLLNFVGLEKNKGLL